MYVDMAVQFTSFNVAAIDNEAANKNEIIDMIFIVDVFNVLQLKQY